MFSHVVCRRCIFVSNQLPLRQKAGTVGSYDFEWDEDSLIAQAKEGLPDDMEAVYVGCLPVEVDSDCQEVRLPRVCLCLGWAGY